MNMVVGKVDIMKFIQKSLNHKNGFAAIILALSLISAGGKGKYYYADPSSYAISLYGINADSIQSAFKSPSGFLKYTKDGAATWHLKIPSADFYRIRILYACDDPGVRIRVSNGDHYTDLDLPETHGYYRIADRTIPRGRLWPHGIGAVPMQNYNRLDLEKAISLKAGKNSVGLSVTVPAGHAPFYFRSLEFLPVQQEKAISSELEDAMAARSNPGWLLRSGYGIMFHWDNGSVPPSGLPLKYADAVRSFNVAAFAAMVKKTGAGYVIFTANHGGTNFPAPLKEWEAVHPGGTTKRDLIAEMANALNAEGIKLIIYLHAQIIADPNIDPHFESHYSNMHETPFANSAIKMITAIGNRYGHRIAGYWFDSFLDIETQYPHFPYKRFYQAAKAGNPDRLVAITNWTYPINTMWQDYWGGELFVTGNPPAALPQSDGPAKGLPFQALITLFGDWVHTKQNSPMDPPIYTVDELGNFINAVQGRGAVTLNTGIYQDGTIGKEQTRYFDQLRERVYGH
jgi:Alpha-L-fucosidase